jgi:hypothetical protein
MERIETRRLHVSSEIRNVTDSKGACLYPDPGSASADAGSITSGSFEDPAGCVLVQAPSSMPLPELAEALISRAGDRDADFALVCFSGEPFPGIQAAVQDMRIREIHSGQYRDYGDSFYVWDVEGVPGRSREEVRAELAGSIPMLRGLPEEREWLAAVRGIEPYPAGTSPSDYFFSGFWKLEPGAEDGSWTLTIEIPYDG